MVREEASAGASPPGSVPPTFDAFIAPTGTNRALVYHQDVSPTGMRPYALPLAAAPALHVVWYPISALSSGPIQHLGIEAAIEQAFGLRSAAGTDGSALAGRTFGNAVHDYAGGLRYRIPFGAGHQVWISGTVGEHAFVFTSPSDCSDCRAMLHIPDIVYRYGRPGIGLRLELPADFSVTLGGGYRYIFNAGGTHLDSYFPHRTVGGVDAELALGYRVAANAGDPRIGPAAPLLLRHAFEGRRHLPRGWGDRSVLDRRPRDGGSAGRRRCARPVGRGARGRPMITGERRDRCRPWFMRSVAQAEFVNNVFQTGPILFMTLRTAALTFVIATGSFLEACNSGPGGSPGAGGSSGAAGATGTGGSGGAACPSVRRVVATWSEPGPSRRRV